jgi:hypothetical protein
VTFWLTQVHNQLLRENGKAFYCPNGHTLVYSDSTQARLEKAVTRANSIKLLLESERKANRILLRKVAKLSKVKPL